MSSQGKKIDQRKLSELSVNELTDIISKTVTNIIEEKQQFEIDRAMGRCPYCHGQRVIPDPLDGSLIPCICTFPDPIQVGIA